MSEILKRDGLSFDLLEKLSYKTLLNKRLKKNLHHFDKEVLLADIKNATEWYDNCMYLRDLTIDYRIKSFQSILLKYNKFYPNHLVSKVFNDILGFRTLCDNYNEVLKMLEIENIRIADMTKGKSNDDGYRGVHMYFQLDNFHYPIEIQYNTYYDRQFNNWLHKYIYKKNYNTKIGLLMRNQYEKGNIKVEDDFKEVLLNVLLDCKEI